jgi:hypothetical protein
MLCSGTHFGIAVLCSGTHLSNHSLHFLLVQGDLCGPPAVGPGQVYGPLQERVLKGSSGGVGSGG